MTYEDIKTDLEEIKSGRTTFWYEQQKKTYLKKLLLELDAYTDRPDYNETKTEIANLLERGVGDPRDGGNWVYFQEK